ncbi:glucosamine-6-phosphate deaminase [Kribbella capetownensis]|uniref:Glucosamine-6-phosphate deaminase n=1 Tax=Kribbella capetownensis TaxID=1572659 RepID=A0A4R0JW13_9ACTN|nr:6-phosphogluconolactonase [Kribbella capetownensis]TCC50817.1 glucosamine-6-phosphate deaminase [Kribbella capetownensis]
MIVDKLEVETLPDPAAVGAAAAAAAAESLRRIIQAQGSARLVLAAAPSQQHTLAALSVAEGIDWSRVEAFHMDEYVGLPAAAEQRFGRWLSRHFTAPAPLTVIDPEGGADPATEAARYAALVAAAPIDIVLAGIGVNGHLAFNEPPADFTTTDVVQVVALDETSRRQQVDEGLFASLDDVPTHAWTLTVPCLLSAREIFCMVSGPAKQDAVRRTLHGPVDPDVPASALRTHPRARLYLDQEASPDE